MGTTAPSTAVAGTPQKHRTQIEDSDMHLLSSDVSPGGDIPRQFTCDGDDVSPDLRWTGVPAGTATFALILDDPDAPPGTWIHWVIWNLDGDVRILPTGVPRDDTLAGGAVQGACWGVHRFSRVGYYGPCPPPGKPHRYFFRLYALDTRLDLPPRSTRAQVDAAMAGHILAETELMGRFGR